MEREARVGCTEEHSDCSSRVERQLDSRVKMCKNLALLSRPDISPTRFDELQHQRSILCVRPDCVKEVLLDDFRNGPIVFLLKLGDIRKDETIVVRNGAGRMVVWVVESFRSDAIHVEHVCGTGHLGFVQAIDIFLRRYSRTIEIGRKLLMLVRVKARDLMFTLWVAFHETMLNIFFISALVSEPSEERAY